MARFRVIPASVARNDLARQARKAKMSSFRQNSIQEVMRDLKSVDPYAKESFMSRLSRDARRAIEEERGYARQQANNANQFISRFTRFPLSNILTRHYDSPADIKQTVATAFRTGVVPPPSSKRNTVRNQLMNQATSAFNRTRNNANNAINTKRTNFNNYMNAPASNISRKDFLKKTAKTMLVASIVLPQVIKAAKAYEESGVNDKKLAEFVRYGITPEKIATMAKNPKAIVGMINHFEREKPKKNANSNWNDYTYEASSRSKQMNPSFYDDFTNRKKAKTQRNSGAFTVPSQAIGYTGATKYTPARRQNNTISGMTAKRGR